MQNHYDYKNVTIIDPGSTYIDKDTIIEEGVIIFPNNTLMGKCRIGKNTILHPNNIITDTEIGENCQITCSVITSSELGGGVCAGPFAYIRPGCKIGGGCKVGSFVELKASDIGECSKIPHLSYVGDAKIGKSCNIGCGVIFANYNGEKKFKSKVGDNCFVGSNSNIIAPVEIGDNAYIAAATTVTKNVESSSFIIGRCRQKSDKKLADKYIKNKNSASD